MSDGGGDIFRHKLVSVVCVSGVDLWPLAFRVWSLDFGLWSLVFGLWPLAFDLSFSDVRLIFAFRHFNTKDQRPKDQDDIWQMIGFSVKWFLLPVLIRACAFPGPKSVLLHEVVVQDRSPVAS